MNLQNELVEEAEACVKLIVKHNSLINRDLALQYAKVLDSLTKRIHLAASMLESVVKLKQASSHFADLLKQLEAHQLTDDFSSLIEKISARKIVIEQNIAYYETSFQHPAA